MSFALGVFVLRFALGVFVGVLLGAFGVWLFGARIGNAHDFLTGMDEARVCERPECGHRFHEHASGYGRCSRCACAETVPAP